MLHNRHIGIDVRGKGIWGDRIAHDIEISNNTVYRNGLHTPYGAAGDDDDDHHAADPYLVRLCWNEAGLSGAVVCRESDGGQPLDGFYHPRSVLVAVQTDGRRVREQDGRTLRWVFTVGEDGAVAVHQNRPRVVARRRHYWDAAEESREADHVEPEPPPGTTAAGRRTRNGFEMSFFLPAAAFAPATLETGVELPAYVCVTNAGARVFESGERAMPAVERIWLSPERWGSVRFGA